MPSTARARARASVLAELTAEARRQLAEVGPGALSVRAVARALGMASSGVYRYVAGRDELLTLVIVDAYDRLADAVEGAAAAHPGSTPADRRRRFVAAATAVWDWAEAHPHEYALLYGTPVPGYAAPDDTIEPVQRLARALLEPLVGPLAPIEPRFEPAEPLRADAAAVGDLVGGLDHATAAGALELWATLFGAVSLHRFGHTRGVVRDGRDWFVQTMEHRAAALGLNPGLGPEV